MKNTNVHIILNTHHVVNMIRQFGYTFWTLTADYSYHTGKPYHTVQVMIFFSRGGGGVRAIRSGSLQKAQFPSLLQKVTA